MQSNYAIVTHGGAGRYTLEDAPALLEGMREATQAGMDVLSAGGTALDAVVAAVVALENNPLFNAGTGSTLNLEGDAEMDAAVMAGRGLRCGSVGALRSVQNPVLVARKVMEETDHALLVGAGAERFAREMGFPEYDPVTPRRLADYMKKYSELRENANEFLPRLHDFLNRYPSFSSGTVGAVALDAAGELAAATSTGGITLKMPGRVGDTAIPGAGNYATPAAAASSTGHGETIIRFLVTKTVCDVIASGLPAQQAVDHAIARTAGEERKEIGVIALDVKGGIGIRHATPFMPHAYFRKGQAEIVASMGA